MLYKRIKIFVIFFSMLFSIISIKVLVLKWKPCNNDAHTQAKSKLNHMNCQFMTLITLCGYHLTKYAEPCAIKGPHALHKEEIKRMPNQLKKAHKKSYEKYPYTYLKWNFGWYITKITLVKIRGHIMIIYFDLLIHILQCKQIWIIIWCLNNK